MYTNSKKHISRKTDALTSRHISVAISPATDSNGSLSYSRAAATDDTVTVVRNMANTVLYDLNFSNLLIISALPKYYF